LSEKGRDERAQMQKQFETKIAKEKKALEKQKQKGQKSLKDMFVKS
jgi:hypothetical protein